MDKPLKKPSRIQIRNRKVILEAALEVFSRYGFRGATLDQIAEQAAMSKPNILYYFEGKEAIHDALLTRLLETWLDPLREMDAQGDPKSEILGYVRRKLDMSRDFPRESRLFANEILQGAPRMMPVLEGELKALVDEKVAVIRGWIAAGKMADMDPYHLIFSIWALTQHYADFDSQIRAVLGHDGAIAEAEPFMEALFTRLLAR